MIHVDADFLVDLLKKAKAGGATDGEALYGEGDSSSVKVRKAAIDTISKAREKRLGLRVFVGKRSAVSSTSDLSPNVLARFVEETCALAKAVVEDPDSGLPEDHSFARRIPDLQLFDDSECGMDRQIDYVQRAEAVVFPYDHRITNSEGSEFHAGKGRSLFVNTRGFVGEYHASSFSAHVTPIASENGTMQRDSWYTVSRKMAGLDAPEDVGTEAARRTVRRLGSRKVPTQSAPVVFDPESAAAILGAFCNAASGSLIYRDASYLKGLLGERVAPEWITIVDDALMPGAIGSRPFDGDGLPSRRTTVVNRGILEIYLLDTYSARKLNSASTGNASRSIGSSPTVGPTNFYAIGGRHAPEHIIGSVERGLYVTDMMGFGVNLVTGDFSRGASGLWIENGELAYPVDGVTIAGNLREMFLNIEMIGNDVTFRGSVTCPTLKISHMMIAGE